MHRLRSLIPSANYLFVFEAAARRLNFTAAAEELNVSQPAVSKTIKLLEEATGLKLFLRALSQIFYLVRCVLISGHNYAASSAKT